ncbi:MAG: DNA polymerase III subunit delta [Candidatus Latescibacteria bacterium]|nr:DNA polymerase III subunit delta [Candidatus Latescibacterota bacterium]
MSRPSARKGAEDLRQEVEAGTRAAFYLLHGDEDYERDALAAWLIGKMAPPAAREFNLEVFHGDQFPVDRFLDVYYSYPMFTSHRLVVIRGCEQLNAECCRSLEAVVDRPAETTVLVAYGGKVDLRRRFFQQLGKKGRAAEFRPPFDNQLPQWIGQHAQRRGLRMDAEAIERLRQAAGPGLRELAGEIEKLALFAGEGARITADLVDHVVGSHPQGDIFALTHAIGQRQPGKAANLLRSLLGQGEEPGRMLWMIHRHFQLLLKAQELMRQRVPREELASRLGVAPFFLDRYLEQARTCRTAHLWDGMGALLWADDQLKSRAHRQEEALLELLLWRLCGLAKAG